MSHIHKEKADIIYQRSQGRCEARLDQRCLRMANQIHHKKKKADGGSNNPINLMAICISCHALIHYPKDPWPGRQFRTYPWQEEGQTEVDWKPTEAELLEKKILDKAVLYVQQGIATSIKRVGPTRCYFEVYMEEGTIVVLYNKSTKRIDKYGSIPVDYDNMKAVPEWH